MKNRTEDVWQEYHERLANFIRSKVSEDFVDDLLQDVFLKIHTNIEKVKNASKLESWLYQITRNTITDYYRKKQITEELPIWLEQPQPDEETKIRKELALCLAPMISKLPDKYRGSVRMSELENKTQQEVALTEGISLSGAKSRVQRGRKQLKKMLQDCCEIEINKKNQVSDFDTKNNCDCC